MVNGMDTERFEKQLDFNCVYEIHLSEDFSVTFFALDP